MRRVVLAWMLVAANLPGTTPAAADAHLRHPQSTMFPPQHEAPQGLRPAQLRTTPQPPAGLRPGSLHTGGFPPGGKMEAKRSSDHETMSRKRRRGWLSFLP